MSKLTKPGFNVLIEKGAGSPSHFSDADYEAAGAKVVDASDVWKNSDIVMKVRLDRTYIFDFIPFNCISLISFILCHTAYSYVLQPPRK